MKELIRENWERLSFREQENLARSLARSLPGGFAFRRVVTHWYCGQRSAIAEFTYQNARFVLIPGGEVSLGYDTAREWKPTPLEAEDWRQTADAYDFNHTLQEHIARATRRPKTAILAPVLMEAAAEELGWQPLSAQDPEVQKIVREELGTSARPQRIEVVQANSCLRVARDEEGVVTAQRSQRQTQSEIAGDMARAGFRLPTSDEWEYACGAGAPTLFRWGDHIPCDRYPTDISPDKAAQRSEWAVSDSAAGAPPEGSAPNWNLHTCANAFGIYIAGNPYHFELVAEPGVRRGGDGGCTICGGAGFFVGWFTLATAYFEAEVCEQDPAHSIEVGFTVARRVLPLEGWITESG